MFGGPRLMSLLSCGLVLIASLEGGFALVCSWRAWWYGDSEGLYTKRRRDGVGR